MIEEVNESMAEVEPDEEETQKDYEETMTSTERENKTHGTATPLSGGMLGSIRSRRLAH